MGRSNGSGFAFPLGRRQSLDEHYSMTLLTYITLTSALIGITTHNLIKTDSRALASSAVPIWTDFTTDIVAKYPTYPHVLA